MPRFPAGIRCPHCNAELPDRELADGWCDSCGKRLPLSLQQEPKRGQAAHPRQEGTPEGKQGTRVLVWGVVVDLLGGLAILLLVLMGG